MLLVWGAWKDNRVIKYNKITYLTN